MRNEIYKEFDYDFEEEMDILKPLDKKIEFTILMPCLNEERTIGKCIKRAKEFIEINDLRAEILVVDNGSDDNSALEAEKNGARVVIEPRKGYGNAIKTGNEKARGKYVILGDSDMTYDFRNIAGYVDSLRKGYNLVVGNRIKGNMQKGAMPFINKHIELEIIKKASKNIGDIPVSDFSCGFRAYEKDVINELDLQSVGNELSSEMILKAYKKGLKMCELPIDYNKDQRNGIYDPSRFMYGLKNYDFIKKYVKQEKINEELEFLRKFENENNKNI